MVFMVHPAEALFDFNSTTFCARCRRRAGRAAGPVDLRMDVAADAAVGADHQALDNFRTGRFWIPVPIRACLESVRSCSGCAPVS